MNNKELVRQMTLVLANTVALWYKANAYHWNVEGPNFPQLHELFKGIYEDIYEQVDTIAEKIRQIRGYPPTDLVQLLNMASIKTGPRPADAQTMIANLEKDNVDMHSILMQAFTVAQSSNDQAVMNYLADRMDAHSKHAWMLRATAKM